MKRKKRTLCEDFPDGSIPREEARRVFRELRAKRLARERRARELSVDASPKAPTVRKQRAQPANEDAAAERVRAA